LTVRAGSRRRGRHCGSWLAHSTLLSGLWIDNQQRYDSLVASNRLTLSSAFHRAGWRTSAVMPATTGAWPEASFYGYERVYDRWTMGYRGPRFNWGTPPDQYTLSAFQHSERAMPGHAPVMAEIPLVTSHTPWAPLTFGLIDWKDVGDGSVFGPMAAAGDRPDVVWRSPGRIRTAYRSSIEYSLNSLITYVETYGDDRLVLVFLGDHQPAPLVTGQDPNRDVPITIVAYDRSVLDQISGWGWQDGLRPTPKATVWPMNAFRDRFLTAFGAPAPPASRSARNQRTAGRAGATTPPRRRTTAPRQGETLLSPWAHTACRPGVDIETELQFWHSIEDYLSLIS
jgi:hypothetical protein